MGVMDLRRNILLNEPHIASAVGNPVAFNTDVKGFLQQAKVGFSPTQSGTGDPSPTNIRPISGWTGVTGWHTGVNAWDEQWVVGRVQSDGTIDETATTRRTTTFIPIVPGETYLHVSPSSALVGRIAFYDASKNLVSYRQDGVPNTGLFTVPNNAYYTRITFGSAYGTTYNNDISINYPSTDTDYHSYSGNSYPVVFPAMGKNLFDGVRNDGYISDIGNIGTDNSNAHSNLIPVTEGQTYTYSVESLIRGTRNRRVHGYNADGTWVQMIDKNVGTGSGQKSCTFSIPTGIAYIRVQFGKYEESDMDIQVEKGTTATSYEPYTNTVYGGSLDLVTGELVAEWIGRTYNGSSSENWAMTGAGNFACAQGDSNNDYRYLVPICDKFEMEQTYYSAYPIRPIGNSAYATTKEEWMTWLASNPIYVVYPLATPLVYQLTPQQIKSLIGSNTIWSDANGNLQIKAWKH